MCGMVQNEHPNTHGTMRLDYLLKIWTPFLCSTNNIYGMTFKSWGIFTLTSYNTYISTQFLNLKWKSSWFASAKQMRHLPIWSKNHNRLWSWESAHDIGTYFKSHKCQIFTHLISLQLNITISEGNINSNHMYNLVKSQSYQGLKLLLSDTKIHDYGEFYARFCRFQGN